MSSDAKVSTKATSTHGAGALLFNNNNILLVQMNYGKFKGHWILPGGMVEKGEHPHEAAIREFKEETNLDIKIEKLLTIRYRQQEGRDVDNLYWVFEASNLQNDFNIKWNEDELISVKFWSVVEALNDPMVRPQTQYYIRLALGLVPKNSPMKLEGPHRDFSY